MTKKPKKSAITVLEPTIVQLYQLALLRANELIANNGHARTPDVALKPSRLLHNRSDLVDRALQDKAASEARYAVTYQQRLRRKALRLLKRANAQALALLLEYDALPLDLRDYGKAALRHGGKRAIAYAYMTLLDAFRWEVKHMPNSPRDDYSSTELMLAQQERGQRVYFHSPEQTGKRKVFAQDVTEIDESDLDDYVKTSDGSLVKASNGPALSIASRTTGDPRGLHIATTFSRKVKRWAYCGHCSAKQSVWFETKAQRGKARHSVCKKVESTPPVREEVPEVTVDRRGHFRDEPVTLRHVFRKSRRGQWYLAQVDTIVRGVTTHTDQPMSTCWVELSNALQRRWLMRKR